MKVATILRAAKHHSGSLAGVPLPCVVDGVLVTNLDEATHVVAGMAEDAIITVTPKLDTARMNFESFKHGNGGVDEIES